MVTLSNNTDWHMRLFRRSLLKQAKWRRIERLLPDMQGKTGLDIGADNGVISLLLRERGGEWSSADADPGAVESIRQLVGERVVLIEDGRLPFGDEAFDCVVIVDMLEHVEDDLAFVKECHRVLKPAGRLIVNVPHVKRFSLIRGLRNLLGLSDADHGHLRPGYRQQQLFGMLKDGFDVEHAETYSRFMVELLDSFMRFAAKHSGGGERGAVKGVIVDRERFRKMEKMFKIYSALYPFFWLAAQIDRLFFFTSGYYLVARARRRLWIPRRIPVLRDGRSIADAALNTKIGSANPY
jgi:2-polyprenyl-3-methyl-5-hydroxy-6-metoxy-1,4-benzoquinol methylase